MANRDGVKCGNSSQLGAWARKAVNAPVPSNSMRAPTTGRVRRSIARGWLRRVYIFCTSALRGFADTPLLPLSTYSAVREERGVDTAVLYARLAHLRRQVDRLDESIADLLDQRFSSCLKIGQVKLALQSPVLQPQRANEVLSCASQAATTRNFSEDFARDLWTLIMMEAARLQRKQNDEPCSDKS